jgi:P pilus assembly chaperone PapD
MAQRLARPFVLLFLCCTAGPAWAAAELLLYPTEVVFQGAQRSVELTLANRGDAIGTFETSWTEMRMTAEGTLTTVEQDAWSIQPFIRHSPRRVTLQPGERQTIKIALRRDGDAAEGEYYSHLRILTLNQEDLDAQEDPANKPPGMSMRARSAVAIPVIWRNSQAKPEIGIDAVSRDTDTDGFSVTVRRAGLLSSRGYLQIVDRLEDGSEGVVGGPIQVVIYPNLNTRTTTIRLQDGHEPSPAARLVLTMEQQVTERTTLASVPLPSQQ